jgi:hypothetical protein
MLACTRTATFVPHAEACPMSWAGPAAPLHCSPHGPRRTCSAPLGVGVRTLKLGRPPSRTWTALWRPWAAPVRTWARDLGCRSGATRTLGRARRPANKRPTPH